jgi:shikimate kinase
MNDTAQVTATVVLIGPPSTGKTTLAPILAERLDLECVSLDDLRWAYYKEIGFEHDHVTKISQEGGFEAIYWYSKPFELHALERVLDEHKGKVIELGGGHSVYEDEVMFEHARLALLPIPYVVLVMPSDDLDESCAVLRARTLQKAPDEGWEPSETVLKLFDHLARHPSNRLLAKQVVYTLGRTPDEVIAELASRISIS